MNKKVCLRVKVSEFFIRLTLEDIIFQIYLESGCCIHVRYWMKSLFHLRITIRTKRTVQWCVFFFFLQESKQLIAVEKGNTSQNWSCFQRGLMERNWIRNSSDDYRISSNNTRWRLITSVFGTNGAIIGRKAIIRGRGLFQILLTRSRALILCSIFPAKKKILESK